MSIELHNTEVPESSQYDLIPGLYQNYKNASESERAELGRQVEEYVALARFAADIGVPFCAEPNSYYSAPHAVLHEMGHWAVKPDSYLQVYRTLSERDFDVVKTDVIIEPPFGDGEVIRGLMMYFGGNDRIPDWDLPDGADPTPNEKANRAWSRHALGYLGLRDPIEIGRSLAYETRGTGDKVIAKAASFRTWASSAVSVPRAIDEMEAFGLDPALTVYRPRVDSLVLPYTHPQNVDELIEDAAAMQAQYPDRCATTPEQMQDWRDQIAWKYGDYLG